MAPKHIVADYGYALCGKDPNRYNLRFHGSGLMCFACKWSLKLYTKSAR